MGKTFLSHEPELFNYNKAVSKNMQSAHFHQTYEVYYLISGSRRYFIKDRFYNLKPGDLILIKPETVHKTQNSPNNVDGEFHERYLLSFSKKIVNSKFSSIFSQCHYRPNKEDSEFIKSIIQKMGEETAKYDPYSILLYEAYLTQILTLLARKYYREIDDSSYDDNKVSSIINTVEAVAKLISNNYSDKNLSLSSLANKYGISKEYLSKSFKKHIGCGFNELLTNTRLAASTDLLLATTFSLTEIAEKCGFKDANYFTAVFKKKMGISPRKYCKQINTLPFENQ